MPIEWYRDLVIIVFGIVSAAVLVFRAVIHYLYYRKTKSVLDSLEVMARNMAAISGYVEEEVIRPLSEFLAVFAGVRQGVKVMSKLFKRE